MNWWPVIADTENPAYFSTQNFDKIYWIEKFDAWNTNITHKNKTWKLQLNWTNCWLAQLVERRNAVRQVEGSSPRADQHSGS